MSLLEVVLLLVAAAPAAAEPTAAAMAACASRVDAWAKGRKAGEQADGKCELHMLLW